jgi:1,4-alpha-glucan branching enzyme
VPDNLSPQLIDSIVHGYNGDPFSVLGPHPVTKDGQPALAIRAFLPWATTLQVARNDGTVYDMTRIHPDGFFEAIIPAGGASG